MGGRVLVQPRTTADERQPSQCPPCLAQMGDGDWWACDHTTREVNLARALARWVIDDPLADEDDIEKRAACFLDDEAGADVRCILEHVEGDETTIWTVENEPEFDTEGGQGFTVNGVPFAVEYQHEGPGVVRPAATWRPPCDICGEPVASFGDPMCLACEADEEAENR